MRTGQGHLYLIDFGIARHFKPGQARDTTPLGSPGYAAPEQYGKAQTTPRTDLYSLGALLHHLLTGEDPAETLFQFAPLPQVMGAEIQLQRLNALIRRMIDTYSERRPASDSQSIALKTGNGSLQVWHRQSNLVKYYNIPPSTKRAFLWLRDGRIAFIDETKTLQYLKVD